MHQQIHFAMLLLINDYELDQWTNGVYHVPEARLSDRAFTKS